MTKRLIETFDMDSEETNIEDLMAEAKELKLSTKSEISELISAENVTRHDEEVNKYANKGFELAKEAAELAMNSEPRHAAELYNSASSLLKMALDAQNAQIDKKTKLLELELKKQKLEFEMKGNQIDHDEHGEYANREDILKRNDK